MGVFIHRPDAFRHKPVLVRLLAGGHGPSHDDELGLIYMMPEFFKL
jgi:hypothetical protein